MADFDSSLPVRTETDGDIKSVIVDPTTTTQQMGVDTNGRIGAVVYGNNGTTDVVIPIDPTSGAVKVDLADATGITVDVDVQQFADGALVNGADLGNLALGTDGTNYQILSVDSTGALNVVTPNPVQISADGSANSALNPIFVETVGSSSDDIHVYGTAVDVAKNATTTITHTVNVGKTFLLKGWGASASGKVKATIDIAGADQMVQFSSTANPNIDGEFKKPIEVAAGVVITVTVQNRDSTQDLYAYINGEEI